MAESAFTGRHVIGQAAALSEGAAKGFFYVPLVGGYYL